MARQREREAATRALRAEIDAALLRGRVTAPERPTEDETRAPVPVVPERHEDEPEPGVPMRFEWEKALRGYRWLTATEKCVAFILATYSDADGSSCYPEVETIARDVGKSASTVQRALRRLEQFGFIKTTPRLGQSNSYQLTMPRGKG
jgi:Helix-turn-helix domain